jgi:hypothetical protein
MMHADKEKEKENGPAQDDQQELDQLEEMWDEMLGRGDDDFYEAFRGNRESRTDADKVSPKQGRRKGRRM